MAVQDELGSGRMVRAANGRGVWRTGDDWGYWSVDGEPRWWPVGCFAMRTVERVCLAVYLAGRLVEVSGPVRR